MTATERDLETRVALIRMTFPDLADTADREAERRESGLTRLPGPAEGTIRAVAISHSLWHSGSNSEAEGLDGSWESGIRRVIKSHPGLKHLRSKL